MIRNSKYLLSYVMAIFFCGLGIFLDQFTKYLAVRYLKPIGNYPLIPGVFSLQYLENRGAAFGIMQGQKPFLITMTILILLVVGWIYFKMPHTKRFYPLRLVSILLVAGAVGNLIDRIRLRFVVDFFFFELINFPVFNVADIFVVVACILFVIVILFYYKDHELNFLKKSKKKNNVDSSKE